jgi:HEAT repeat protein
MKLEEVKNQFPESAGDINILESLGLNSRQEGWIDGLDLEQAQTACWLVGRIGNDRDADTLVSILSGQRHELWMQAATSLSLIATQKHLIPLRSILATSSDPAQRKSVVYTLSFLSQSHNSPDVIRVLCNVAANRVEAPVVRAQALEGLGNKLSQELPPNLYQDALTVILEALDHADAEIRFWGCFAVGAIRIEAALPKLQVLAQTDNAIVEGWWSVGEEAADSITLINGGDPPLRQPSPSPTP